MSNIYDVAKKANVSTATVSRIINNTAKVSDKTRNKVMDAINELNYSINITARSLATKKSYTIGVIIPDITSIFFSTLVKGVEECALKKNFNLLIRTSENTSEKEIYNLSDFKSRNVDGIIISCTDSTKNKNKHILNLIEKEKPLVLVDRYIPEISTSFVITDNILGGILATEHLIKQGHKDIALLNGPLSISICKERRDGYEKALKKNRININEEYQFFGDLTAQSGYNIAKEILSLKNPPSAIFSVNDLMAIGAIKYFNEIGLPIPEKMALIGFDDVSYSNFIKPSLSSISQNIKLMGNKATEILIENILNPNNELKQIILPPKIIIRETSSSKVSNEWNLNKIL